MVPPVPPAPSYIPKGRNQAFALIDLVEQPQDIGSLHRHPDVLCPHPNTKITYLHQGGAMIERNITLPEMILWTGTRVALGAGIGMLISRRLSKDAMKAAGLALTVVGGFTTIPLAIAIICKKNLTRPEIRSVA
jgi:hypothetical protein